MAGWSGQATLPTEAATDVPGVPPAPHRHGEELVDLVRGDIDQDPAVDAASQNHSGRRSALSRCGPAPMTCTTLPIAPARANSTAARRAVLETLGEQDRPGAPVAPDDRPADLVELFGGGDTGFVAEHVLAGA